MPRGKDKFVVKVISAVVVFAFISNYVLSDAWAVVLSLDDTTVQSTGYSVQSAVRDEFYLPKNLGTIDDSWFLQTSNSKLQTTVIHIQDAHCNYAAEHKISEIIKYLADTYGINTVNLEGGKGSYDLSSFTSIQDKTTREKTSDLFVKEGLMNGAEYFAANNPGKIKLWGVEDDALYFENLGIYRESLKYKSEALARIGKMGRALDEIKKKVYSPELLKFDAEYSGYKAETIEFKGYFAYLIRVSEENALNITQYSNISFLKESVAKEGEIDFKKANAERDELIGRLEGIISDSELRELVLNTVNFSEKKLAEEDFYAYLAQKAEEVNLDVKAFPELVKYVGYVSLYKAVDKSRLMEEIDALEVDIIGVLSKDAAAKELAGLSKNLALMKNLFNISLTKRDYEYYKKNESSFAASNFTKFVKDENFKNLDRSRAEISKFYECSFKRDETFLKNLRFENTEVRSLELGVGSNGQRATGDERRVTVLITGGFHTENLAEMFKKKGISYISITPSFENDKEYKSPYFDLLAGAKSDFIKFIETGMSNLAIGSMFSEMKVPDGVRSDVLKQALEMRGNDETPPTSNKNGVFTEESGKIIAGKSSKSSSATNGGTFKKNAVVTIVQLAKVFALVGVMGIVGEILRSGYTFAVLYPVAIIALAVTLIVLHKFFNADKNGSDEKNQFSSADNFEDLSDSSGSDDVSQGALILYAFIKTASREEFVESLFSPNRIFPDVKTKNEIIALFKNDFSLGRQAKKKLENRFKEFFDVNYSASFASMQEGDNTDKFFNGESGKLYLWLMMPLALLGVLYGISKYAGKTYAQDGKATIKTDIQEEGTKLENEVETEYPGVGFYMEPTVYKAYPIDKIREFVSNVKAALKESAQGLKGLDIAVGVEENLGKTYVKLNVGGKEVPSFVIDDHAAERLTDALILLRSETALPAETRGVTSVKPVAPEPTGTNHPFRFSKNIWKIFKENLLKHEKGAELLKQVNFYGLAWTDAEGGRHYIDEIIKNKEDITFIWNAAKDAINEANLRAAGSKKSIKNILEVKMAVDYHESIHELLKKEEYRPLIAEFRKELARQIGAINPNGYFITSFKETYGEAPANELKGAQDTVNWYIEEFLTLTIQEGELFGDYDAVLDNMHSILRDQDAKAFDTLRPRIRQAVNNVLQAGEVEKDFEYKLKYKFDKNESFSGFLSYTERNNFGLEPEKEKQWAKDVTRKIPGFLRAELELRGILNVVPDIKENRRKSPTYAIVPIISGSDETHVTYLLNGIWRKSKKDGNAKDYPKGYLAEDGKKGLENVKSAVRVVMDDFYRDVTTHSGIKYDKNATRMVIRLLSKNGEALSGQKNEIKIFIFERIYAIIEEENRQFSIGDKLSVAEIEKIANSIVADNVKFVTAYADASSEHLNTLVDLYTDLTAVDCDRYGKGNGYPNQKIPAGLENRLMALLRLSTDADSFKGLVDAAKLNFKDKDEATAVVQTIFAGLYVLGIRPIDWASLAEWRKAQTAILASL